MNNTQKFLLVGGITYVLMGIGEAIFTAPFFCAILFVLFDLLMWIGDGDTYNAIGFLIGTIDLFAIVLGIGLVIHGNIGGGLLLWWFLSSIAIFAGEAHHDPINHPNWGDINRPKIEAAMAQYEAEDAAKIMRKNGIYVAPPSISPNAPTVTTPATPKPYVLTAMDYSTEPTVRAEPQITRPTETTPAPVVTPASTGSTLLGKLLWRVGIIAAVGGVFFVGCWLLTLGRTKRRASQSAKFAWTYSDENPANWR